MMYLLLCCAAADIPSTRMLSREPAGMNSTGESDLRNYYDRLSSEQNVKYRPALSRLDEVLIRHTFGTRDPSIRYDWNPLWQMTAPEKADCTLKKAQAFKIDVESGMINHEALSEARVSQLVEDGVYPGLDAAIERYGEGPDDDMSPAAQAENQNKLAQQQLQVAKQSGGPGGKKPAAKKPGNPKTRRCGRRRLPTSGCG
jgi:uncharacterized protein